MARVSWHSRVRIGQIWEHKRTGERVHIDNIYRKDRQVKITYIEARNPSDIGACEVRNWSLFEKFYRLYSWGEAQL